jgi:Protein of unknown function (DUF3251)
MATMSVACQCGRSLRVGVEHAGRRGKCPGCGHSIEIPNAQIQASAYNTTSAGAVPSATEVRLAQVSGPESERKRQATEAMLIEVENKPHNNQMLAVTGIVVSSIALLVSLFAVGFRPNKPNALNEAYVLALASRVGNIEYRQSIQFNLREALLDPASKSYSRVDSQVGFFLMSCQNVQPFLDGYKVTLHVGNPQNTDYSGFKLKTRWGSKYKGDWSDQPAVANWLHSLKTQEFTFTSTLLRGRWNEAEITLGETSLDQMGALQVSIDANVVSLGLPLKATPP